MAQHPHVDLMRRAHAEIITLRRENEILLARQDTLDLVAGLLFGQPAQRVIRGAAPDIAHELGKRIQELSDLPESNVAESNVDSGIWGVRFGMATGEIATIYGPADEAWSIEVAEKVAADLIKDGVDWKGERASVKWAIPCRPAA